MSEILSLLQEQFSKIADKDRAEGQKRYMKSCMPFWGIVAADIKAISNNIFKQYPPKNNDEYREVVLNIFENATHREEWYAGCLYANKFKEFINEDNIDLYIKLVRITQWWDTVDNIAPNLVGRALLNNDNLKSYLTKWINDENMWVRRVALLVQLKYKDQTNFKLFSKLALTVANEKEFFIRKAIGWALRQYSYTNPSAVGSFIEKNKKALSPLSAREGMKAILRKANP